MEERLIRLEEKIDRLIEYHHQNEKKIDCLIEYHHLQEKSLERMDQHISFIERVLYPITRASFLHTTTNFVDDG